MTNDEVYNLIMEELRERELNSRKRPTIRIFDGVWNLIGYVTDEYSGKVTWKQNDTGLFVLDMPADNWIAEWVAAHDERQHDNVHVVVEKGLTRWSGRMEFCKLLKDRDSNRRGRLTVQFRHDYEELKHILVWSNPFLPAEVQFPKAWTLFGPAKWALSVTLFVNIMRLEGSFWMLPDDPGDLSKWFNLDQSTWWNVMKPFPFSGDNSNVTTVLSRFKTFHETARKILADAQLTVQCRRWLEGDPPPWPGANVRNGALVWEIVDKSGWTKETSFGGNLLTGLRRERIRIQSDGMTEGIEVIPDPNYPDEYFQPEFKGTLPKAPWVIFRDGEYTGVTTQEFTLYPATDTQFVAGGHSMPGVNEVLKFAIIGLGGFLGSFIGQAEIGSAVAALTEPLWSDVFLAFHTHKMIGRAQKLGNHYHEHFVEGGDRAYTLGSLMALRAGKWKTRQVLGHKFTVAADACGYDIGEDGDCWLGDRVGVAVKDFSGNKIYVEQISEITFEWDVDSPGSWGFEIGHIEPEDPTAKAMQKLQEVGGVLQAHGVL